MPITSVAVTGLELNPDGTPAAGTVAARCSANLENGAEVVPAVIASTQLLIDGSWSVTLAAVVGDAGTEPTDATYEFLFDLAGDTDPTSYPGIVISAAMAPTVSFASLIE